MLAKRLLLARQTGSAAVAAEPLREESVVQEAEAGIGVTGIGIASGEGRCRDMNLLTRGDATLLPHFQRHLLIRDIEKLTQTKMTICVRLALTRILSRQNETEKRGGTMW